MKIDRAIVSRKFNLGNYESLDMALEYQLTEGDNPKQVLAELREAIEMEFIDMQRKGSTPTAKPAPKCTKYAEDFKQYKDIELTQTQNEVEVHVTKFLDTAVWNEVHGKVKALGGKWDRADGFWRIPAC